MTAELVAFLHARLDDIATSRYDVHDCNCAAYTWESRGDELNPARCNCGWPTRLWGDGEAKRRIIERCAAVLGDAVNYDFMARNLADETLRDLAAPDADHPAYQELWRP